MKKRILLLTIIFLSFAQKKIFSQNSLPYNADFITVNGDSIKTSQIKIDSGFVILDFWNTGCKPCIAQLNAFTRDYDKVLNKRIRIIAISTFPPDKASKRLIEKYQWPFEIYYDFTARFFKKYSKMNVTVPFIVIIDADLNIIYKQRGASVMYEESDGTLVFDREKISSAMNNGEWSRLVTVLDKYFNAIEKARNQK
jgi:peroxiredoxin